MNFTTCSYGMMAVEALNCKADVALFSAVHQATPVDWLQTSTQHPAAQSSHSLTKSLATHLPRPRFGGSPDGGTSAWAADACSGGTAELSLRALMGGGPKRVCRLATYSSVAGTRATYLLPNPTLGRRGFAGAVMSAPSSWLATPLRNKEECIYICML